VTGKCHENTGEQVEQKLVEGVETMIGLENQGRKGPRLNLDVRGRPPLSCAGECVTLP